jgi:two-component system catabolic regulation response regulator CreB
VTTSILLIEDDKPIAENVALALTREGMSCRHTMLAAEGLELLRVGSYDLAILDVGLPDGNGFDVCRTLRSFSNIPVIFLTARSDEIDRVVGLEIGADDYVLKPFSPRELAARVKALLRRAGAPAAALAASPALLHDDAAGQRICLRGEPLALTRREYRLLACLLAGAGRIHARETLLAAAWGDESDSHDRTVDTHIKTLRAKLREADPSREYIQTHRGMGYCLNL